jgi:DNA mismatch endonuclease (patch repair protein)
MDRISPAARSRNMSRIRRRDPRPEQVVRRLLHGMGFRFRLHRKDLPGTPDIVLPRWRAVVFVHGCFWHRHARCPRAYTPASREDYWLPKLARNVERDRENRAALAARGWRAIVVWECELKDLKRLRNRLLEELTGRTVRRSAGQPRQGSR